MAREGGVRRSLQGGKVGKCWLGVKVEETLLLILVPVILLYCGTAVPGIGYSILILDWNIYDTLMERKNK